MKSKQNPAASVEPEMEKPHHSNKQQCFENTGVYTLREDNLWVVIL